MPRIRCRDTRLIRLLAWLLCAISTGAVAQEGEALYRAKGCMACHGPAGKQPLQASYPRLAGQNREYLVRQIKDIRDGERTNGQTAMMRPIVQGLSDQEIEAVAGYLSEVQP